MPLSPKTAFVTLFLGTEQYYKAVGSLRDVLFPASMGSHGTLTKITAWCQWEQNWGWELGNATMCSKWSLTVIWKVPVRSSVVPVCGLYHLSERPVGYLVVNLCWAPCWLQCLQLLLRCSHAHAV